MLKTFEYDVVITKTGERSYSAYCADFDDYGVGDSAEEALKDLKKSITYYLKHFRYQKRPSTKVLEVTKTTVRVTVPKRKVL